MPNAFCPDAMCCVSAQALCQYFDLLIEGLGGDASGGIVERVEHHLQYTAHRKDCQKTCAHLRQPVYG
jgi:hypothetical protein